MKAVIVELRGHDAAALTDDGCILKMKNKKYAIGQVIELKTAAWRSTKFIAWAASAAAAVIVLGVGAWAYFTPYSYVSLDVNPSIEYSVNRFDRVLSATAVNNDGETILSNLDLNNKTIDEAVKETVDQISQNGYFEGTDPGGIVISTSSQNQEDAQQLAQDLQTTAQEETKDAATPVEVQAISVGLARVQEARTLGTTPGKLNLVQKLQASSAAPDSINVEEWLNKPVKEIMKAIKQNKAAVKTGDAQGTDEQDTSSSQAVQSSASSAESQAASSAAQVQAKAAKQNSKAKAKGSSSSGAASSFSSSTSSGEQSTSSQASVSENENVNVKSNAAGAKQNENAKQNANNGKGNNK